MKIKWYWLISDFIPKKSEKFEFRKNLTTRIPTVKLKTPGKTFLKSETRTSVTFKLYRSKYKWTRKWSEFISTKMHLFRVGFHEEIILAHKNLDHGWSGCWLVDDLVQVHLDNFSNEKWRNEFALNELGPNHQPISDQINHGPSSYRPKLLLPGKPTRKNAFLSIWTRTIFEFIYAMTCTLKYLSWVDGRAKVYCLRPNWRSFD